jgi:hypothetical protein
VPSLESAHIIKFTLSERAQRDPVVALREGMEQTLAASELEPGRLTAIPATIAAADKRGLLRKLASIGPRVQVHRAVRCTCLIAKGYVGIGAGRDAKGTDWVWGRAPSNE